MPVVPPNYATLSAMITPAIFLTANGSLIISTSNRMSRIVDRIRLLNEQSDRLRRGAADLDFPADRLAHIRDQTGRLLWRADRIRYALVMLYLGFSSFVLSSLGLAVDVLFSNRIPALPTSFALVGVVLMLGACVNLVREALEALRSNRLEVRFYLDLNERRSPGGAGG